ncbi:hypothetical protein D6D26_09899 [Aureobasidium pullulans]|nr:hypothetical protein D6D26_09899 [Aureobasidium pullulans]
MNSIWSATIESRTRGKGAGNRFPKILNAKRKIEEPRFRLSDRLHKWTLGLKDRKDGVQWRSHEPIFYTEKEPHDCQYCSTRQGGAKLLK